MIRVTKKGNDISGVELANAHHYEFARLQLVFQEPVAALSAFAEGRASDSYSQVMARHIEVVLLDQENAELEYCGTAPFENQLQEVMCWSRNSIRQIDVAGVPICRIDMQASHIHVLNSRSFDDCLNLEVVTGPALILLMAAEKIYCLHAGAVATPYGNIAFIAESGTGKSTLSRHQDEQWQQVADDILPLSNQPAAHMLPNYPQLKLSQSTVPIPIRGQLSLDLIIRLSIHPSEVTRFRRLPRTEAMLQIVRHTVAAKLFDRQQLREHARFAKHLSGQVALVEMSYPRDLNKLSALRRAVIDYLRLGQFN